MPRIRNSEMPMSAKPGPISRLGGTRSVSRPAIAAVKKIGTESTRKRTPIWIADSPSPPSM